MKSGSIRRRNRNHNSHIIVGSAHKVGSTWLVKILNGLGLQRKCYRLPIEFRQNLKIPALLKLDSPEIRVLLRKNSFYTFKTHSFPPDNCTGLNAKFATVIRDPRDVVISAVYYLEKLPQTQGGWPFLRDMGIDQKIRTYLDRAEFDADLMRAWARNERVHVVRFEDLKASPRRTVSQLLKNMEFIVTDDEVGSALDFASFKRQSGGRKSGQKDDKSFFRKGVVGDWRNYFTPEIERVFNEVHGGKWARLTEELGY